MVRTETELFDLIEEKLEDAIDELWDALEPSERMIVFTNMILEYIETNW